jgi:lysophospholipase L1-like esterase
MKHIRIFAICVVFLGSTSAQQASESCQAVQERAQEMEATLRDWPNLARYAQADSQLSAAKKGERRAVFLGDSITDGWNLAEYFPGKPYVNRGISGQTTPQMLIRLRPDVINLQPKAMAILAGTNDLAGNTGPMTLGMIEDNLSSIAELARAHSIRVVLASLLPVSDYGKEKQTEKRPPEKIKELNAWIKKYCQQHGLVYLDYYSHMVDAKGMLPAELSEDGLHPNAAGYKVMAPLAEKAVQQALGRTQKKSADRKQPRHAQLT